jgi:hypothetical protein
MNGLAVQVSGEVEQHLRHLAAGLQPVRARTVIPLLQTLQFKPKPQHLHAEFFGAKLFQGETPCGMRRASLQQGRRAKQTANVLSAIGSGHVELFPRLRNLENDLHCL